MTVLDHIVPLRFADRTLVSYIPETPSQGKALAAAQALVEGAIRSLVLVGPPGVGKTHLAAGILAATYGAAYQDWREHFDGNPAKVQREPARPIWVNVAELIVDLRSEMDRPADDRDAGQTVYALRGRKALAVLDDLGREKASDWTSETIYALVNARYERLLPTIVTSNLTAAELVASGYWPAISRLAEDGELIEITAPDRRLAR